jgi:hypothetical protein
MKILLLLLDVINKWLGIKQDKNKDPDVARATKKKVEVKTRDDHEEIVADAVESGDLDELRKRAGQ